MRKVRISLLAALLVGIAAVTLINEIGISRYPPTGVFSDGAVRGFFPDDVRSCMGARALAAVGDRTSQWHCTTVRGRSFKLRRCPPSICAIGASCSPAPSRWHLLLALL
jgi:hypothetical protein